MAQAAAGKDAGTPGALGRRYARHRPERTLLSNDTVRILGDRCTGPRTDSKTQRAVVWEAELV